MHHNLRAIIHLDLDCFYCQVDQVRLGIPDDWPLAVQQWNNLIAVNYVARKRGVDRHASYKECLQICPDLRFVHVPTLSITDTSASYSSEEEADVFKLKMYSVTDRTSAFCPDRMNCKASLLPYREASLKIFEEIRIFLTQYPGAILEKAGLDECFIDVSATSFVNDSSFFDGKIYGKLAINDDDDAKQKEEYIIMEKDIKIINASKIANDIREHIYEKLKYRVSAGIAKNKLLSKLGSAKNKPNNQTVILEDMILPFLKDLPIRKLRFLGGKMGSKLVEGLPESSTCSSIWPLKEDELAEKLDSSPAIGEWTFGFVRGEDTSPVQDRSLIKSFMSAKNFILPLTKIDNLIKWTSLLFHELSQRVIEEKIISNRWPRSLVIRYTTNSLQKSKTLDFLLQPLEIPKRNAIMVDGICKLLELEEKCIFPLSQLSLGIHNFQTLSIKRIDSFPLHKIDAWERDRINRIIDLIPQPHSPIDDLRKKKIVKKNLKIDSFLKITNEEEHWKCPQCSKKTSLDWLEIEEHENYHLAEGFL